MRIVSKKIAMGLIGGLISVVPLSKVAAQSTLDVAKNIHSSSIINKNLQGVGKDTYDATKKVTTAPIKSGIKRFKSLGEMLTASGFKVLESTDNAIIYDVPKSASAKLKNEILNAVISEVEQIKIAVPLSNKAADVEDFPIMCTFKSHIDKYSGVTAETSTTALIKGDDAKFIDLEVVTSADGKAYRKSYYVMRAYGETGEATKLGFTQTNIITNSGATSAEYGLLGKDRKLPQDEFYENKKLMIEGFEDLLPNHLKYIPEQTTPAPVQAKETTQNEMRQSVESIMKKNNEDMNRLLNQELEKLNNFYFINN